ncbi:MAG: hypothetical protein NC350_01000 [Corallococcus sp.]|nr:hypothetical protein [Corallococcus sp.]
MKKLFSTLIVVVMVLTMVFALTACNDPHVCGHVCPTCQKCTDADCKDEVCKEKCQGHSTTPPVVEPTTVAEKIAAAEKMTLTELEAAAEKEFKAQSNIFDAQYSTSGMKKVMTEFKKKYDWFNFNDSHSTLKDSQLLTAVQETVVKGSYWADFALLQQGAQVKAFVDQKYLYSYAPKADEEVNVSKDANGMVIGAYADKLFLYNKKEFTDVELTNVWQLTGKDGADGKKAMPRGISFQNPTVEAINYAFLAMLTNADSVAKLTTAYKSYFGTDYVAQSDYDNIGYYFIHEFLANLKENGAQHSSDTTVGSTILPGTAVEGDKDYDLNKAVYGRVYVIGLNKMKSYPSGREWTEEIFVSGVGEGNHLEGFDGFTYSFYMTIPATTRLPYTACLLARYTLTDEGFHAGWNEAGYYPANPKVTPQSGYLLNDKTIMENPSYVESINREFRAFITNEMA